MAGAKKAFTFAELIIVVLFLGILAYIAVPKLQFAALYRRQADTVARRIATDLRLTRTLAISYAATNVVGFALNMSGSEPYSGYEIANLDTGETVSSHSIDPEIACTGGSTFKFGPLGNLLAGSDTQLIVSSSGKTFTISVISATGAVKCAEN